MKPVKKVIGFLLLTMFALSSSGCFLAIGSSPDNVIYTQPTQQQAPQPTLMSPYDVGPVY
jgi:hypothetical protein